MFKLLIIFLTICALPAVALLGSAFGNWVGRSLSRKATRALVATNQWCDARDELDRWIGEHPFYSESDREFQRLLQVKIGAYMLWLDAHPYLAKQKHHREFLNSLVEKISGW